MRGVSIAEFGGVNVLRYLQDVTLPKLNPSSVIVAVHAAGMNPVDTYIRSGTHIVRPVLPYTPGKDGAGVVHEVGAEVAKFKVGDRVWFNGSETGSCAEFASCHQDNVGHLPQRMSFADGAMIGTPYLTAAKGMQQAGGIKSGMKILIHGATGGVGTALVQLCGRIEGVQMFCTAGSQQGIDMLNGMGVNKVYNHSEDGYVDKMEKENFDCIFEMLANVNLNTDIKIVAEKGTIVVIGCRGALEFNPRSIMVKQCYVTGVALTKATAAEKETLFADVTEAIATGNVKPVLWKCYSLEQVREAHEEMITNSGSRGQIVFNVPH